MNSNPDRAFEVAIEVCEANIKSANWLLRQAADTKQSIESMWAGVKESGYDLPHDYHSSISGADNQIHRLSEIKESWVSAMISISNARRDFHNR